MFQSLRNNSQFFILHKESRPYLEVGNVVSVSQPMPKFPMPQSFGQPQEMVVDVIVNINGQTFTYQKLPANLDIADSCTNANIVVSANREAMNSEIASLKQKSIDIINSIDFHKEVITGCDQILTSLNPEFAEKQRQQTEINSLKEQMASMSQNMSDLMAMNKELMSKLNVNLKKE